MAPPGLWEHIPAWPHWLPLWVSTLALEPGQLIEGSRGDVPTSCGQGAVLVLVTCTQAQWQHHTHGERDVRWSAETQAFIPGQGSSAPCDYS
jgi:hypothetical protein